MHPVDVTGIRYAQQEVGKPRVIRHDVFQNGKGGKDLQVLEGAHHAGSGPAMRRQPGDVMRPVFVIIWCVLALVAWVGPAPAQNAPAPPASQSAPPADTPQQKAPEPAAKKAAVTVEHNDTDPLGGRLAYRLKELLGRSALMRSARDLQAGQTLTIPGREGAAPSSRAVPQPAMTVAAVPAGSTYVVRPGDTLSSISQRAGVDMVLAGLACALVGSVISLLQSA